MDDNGYKSARQARFGKWLKFKRIKAKLTQRELADKLEVTPSYISKMERGKTETQPSLEVLFQMAHIFDMLPLAVMNQAGVIDRDKLQALLDYKPDRACTLNYLMAKWEMEDNE